MSCISYCICSSHLYSNVLNILANNLGYKAEINNFFTNILINSNIYKTFIVLKRSKNSYLLVYRKIVGRVITKSKYTFIHLKIFATVYNN